MPTIASLPPGTDHRAGQADLAHLRELEETVRAARNHFDAELARLAALIAHAEAQRAAARHRLRLVPAQVQPWT